MRHRKSQRFVFDGSRGNPRAEKQARQVIVQCVLYAATFINMMFWATIQTLLRVTNVSEDITKNHIWVAYLTAFFFPLQGLFNFMIFIRPRYLSKREANTEKGRWFSLREAVWNPAGRRQSSSRGSSNTVNQSPQPRKQQIKLPDPVQCSSVFLAGQLPDESESAHPSEVDEERTTRSTSIKTARTSTASSMPPSLPLEPAICSSSKN